MDLTQQKLTKSEWEYLEVPVVQEEKKILQLIYNSFEDINYTYNESKSLLGYMRIYTNNNEFHFYLYDKYFKKIIDKLIKKYELSFVVTKNMKSKKKLKTADLIRITNSSQKLNSIKDNIYEFILLSLISKFLKNNYCPKQYYTITQLLKNNVLHLNKIVKSFIIYIIDTYENRI